MQRQRITIKKIYISKTKTLDPGDGRNLISRVATLLDSNVRFPKTDKETSQGLQRNRKEQRSSLMNKGKKNEEKWTEPKLLV